MRESTGIITSVGLLVVAGMVALGLRWTWVDPDAALRRDRREPQDVLLSPGPDILQLAALEHPSAWADVLWLGIVQELGRKLEGTETNWDRLERWSNIATDLDPRYFVVYYGSSIHLSVYARRIDASDQLAQKGMRALPRRWEFPFLLGYNAYFSHGYADLAADYWRAAAAEPDSPRFLPSLAARAQFQAGDEDGAVEMLKTFAEVLTGPQREDAELRLKLFQSEFRMRKYDAACQAYREAHGRVPTPEELHAAGLVEDPPQDLLGARMTLDAGCRARTEYVFVREDEALDNVGMDRRRSEQLDKARREVLRRRRADHENETNAAEARPHEHGRSDAEPERARPKDEGAR
ncbi:MAG: hypothetical protein IPK13_23680 [Deltaproteobacteria bacterium]|nr:hypothetical protein [Deltaproteobacteria bacterium]